jgi:glutathione synthase/RimK-type ligase-like ATP-grasp enzyme
MIVFFGRLDDRPLSLAMEHAAEAGVAHLAIDQTRLHEAELLLDVGTGRVDGRLRTCGADLELGAITAVYARPLTLPAIRDELARVRAEHFDAAFMEWLDEASCLVVNRPRAMRSNASKPYQLQLVAGTGMPVPPTLVTNRPDAVRAFQARHGRVVYKSISGIRSIVTELDAESIGRLGRIRSLPTQFQAYVEGEDVRVHVVGERVFATEIASAATDYRYAHRNGEAATLSATELPAVVERRCLALARALELPFCGIDLRRRPDGVHVCFEVNPMPAFAYFEGETGQPIAAALVELLATAGANVDAWSPFART